MRTRTVYLFGALLLIQWGAIGCAEDPDDAIDRRLDCRGICDRYAECFDSDYDVDECYDNCVKEADEDAKFEDKVDACDECISGISCAEGAFTCATECISIVP